MDSFLSKASSYMNSQAEQGVAPSTQDEAHRKPASSGGYGDLLAGAQSLMQGGTNSSAEGSTQKSPSSTGNYGDLLAGAQALMKGTAKQNPQGDHGMSTDQEEAYKSPSSGGDMLLPGSHGISDSAKPSSGNVNTSMDKEESDAQKNARSGSYGDVFASTQVLMKAAQQSGKADMGEVAGAAANLIDAGSQYGNLEKSGYGEYAKKAQAYLHDYQASHTKPGLSNEGAEHKFSGPNQGSEEDYNPGSNAPVRKVAGEGDDQKERPTYA